MNKNYIIAILAVFALWMFMKEQPQEVNTVTVTTTDTLVITDTIDIVTEMTDTLYYPEYITKYLSDTVEVFVYADTVQVDENFSVSYIAHVEGQIRSINFGIIGKYPVQTQVITNEKTITNTIPNSGLYVGAFATSNSTVGLGVDYIKGKNQFGLGYGLNKELVVSYKRKIL